LNVCLPRLSSTGLPRTKGDGAAVDVEVAVNVAIHGEMLAGDGGAGGGQ